LTLTNNEMIDLLFEGLINVMIKNGYESLNIDQLIALKHVFRINPLEEEGKNLEFSQSEALKS